MKSDLVAVGALIRQWRKYRKMTLDDLSNAIYKSKATVSKYENGEITMDLSTLYDISRALNIEVHQLLVTKSDNETVPAQASRSSFWSDANKLYVYYYDHRITRIIPGILEITEEMNSNKAGAILYMDYNQLEFYHVCASTYTGYVEYFDSGV